MGVRLREARQGSAGAAAPVELDADVPAALSEPVLESCGVAFTWGDIVEWMVDDGSWAVVSRRAAKGRALASADVAAPSGPALRAAASQFRRARMLGAADDLDAWLVRWDISVEQWVEWLERSLRCGDASAGVPLALREVWVDAVCSGALEDGAQRLAASVGAWAERSGGASPPEGDRWAELRHAYEELVTRVPPRGELDRMVATHAADWLRVALTWARFDTVDAGLEAVACCRHDGQAFAEIAARAGVDCSHALLCAEELPASMRAAAMSSLLGKAVLVGTSQEPGLVLVVSSREPPSLVDPVVEQLAVQCWVDERVQAAIDRWVRWKARHG